MEYYVVIEGQKQGPYDLLSLIKKIKNGSLTAETLVSDNEKTAFRPAADFEEIKSLLKQEKHTIESRDKSVNLSLKDVLAEGVELWTRRVIEYTIASGIILALGFGISVGMKKAQFLADFPSVINYSVSFVITTLFSILFYYILITRRSQEPDMKDFSNSIRRNILKIALFAALFSLYAFPFEINMQAGLLGLCMIIVAASFLIFVPFLIQDSDLSLRDAARLSIDRVKTMGLDNFGIVIALIAINLAVAIIPALINENLFVFGLFISIPITVSSLAFIYDQIFA